ncbi:hypothetical protein [Streptomyces sp. Ac-502]|uniref:hypothetical protein n=1 Tax=Streptomyces sp. Ac-502 TaxID=3342801 RepID=UPI0038627E5D
MHGAVEGTLEPAIPVAGVHALWWRAANTFDDVSDGDLGSRLYGGDPAAVMTAALECGYALPLRALAALPVPGPLRERLTADYLDGWTAACDGQVGDILGSPTGTGPEDVLTVYRHKSGSVYAMAATMAARLALGADGADDPRAAAWGSSGRPSGCSRSSATTRTTCAPARARTSATAPPPTSWSSCCTRPPTRTGSRRWNSSAGPPTHPPTADGWPP